jgi:hypothetical protein
MLNVKNHFYIVAHEPGRENSALPTWADSGAGVIDFEQSAAAAVRRIDIAGVPGAFQLLNLLTSNECDQFVQITDSLGYHTDSPVSLPHSIRHNLNLNWVVDDSVDGPIWARSKTFISEGIDGHQPLGLNARFRFYRYAGGDFFKPHTDGAWPGSRVIDRQLVHDAYGDRESQMTILIFLSGGYTGGRTVFFVPDALAADDEVQKSPNVVSVSTPKGGALCFPHGFHPQHCLHAGEGVESGVKYIIRSDVLYPLRSKPES